MEKRNCFGGEWTGTSPECVLWIRNLECQIGARLGFVRSQSLVVKSVTCDFDICSVATFMGVLYEIQQIL